jgi:hypothetical protein
MNRRDTITALLALGTAAGPLAGRTQPTATTQRKTLGVLTLPTAQDAERVSLGGFRAALK